jgi:hypothetical protein
MVMRVEGELREIMIELRKQLDYRTPNGYPQKVITIRRVDAEELLRRFDYLFGPHAPVSSDP